MRRPQAVPPARFTRRIQQLTKKWRPSEARNCINNNNFYKSNQSALPSTFNFPFIKFLSATRLKHLSTVFRFYSISANPISFSWLLRCLFTSQAKEIFQVSFAVARNRRWNAKTGIEINQMHIKWITTFCSKTSATTEPLENSRWIFSKQVIRENQPIRFDVLVLQPQTAPGNKFTVRSPQTLLNLWQLVVLTCLRAFPSRVEFEWCK